MAYIDADAFIEDIKTEVMNLYLDGMKGTPRPYKELYDIIDRIKEQPTADVVEVDKVAEMFAAQFGDKCPCNFNDNDEWLTLYCDYTNTCDCPCKDGWKQFIKHYDKRKEQ